MFWISLLCAISTEIEAAYAVGRLPPIPSSAALVSKSENTNCNSLTVWHYGGLRGELRRPVLCPLCGTILLNSMVSMPAISTLCLSMGVWSPPSF